MGRSGIREEADHERGGKKENAARAGEWAKRKREGQGKYKTKGRWVDPAPFCLPNEKW